MEAQDVTVEVVRDKAAVGEGEEGARVGVKEMEVGSAKREVGMAK